MKISRKRPLRWTAGLFLVGFIASVWSGTASAGTSFTYQGRLEQGGSPANGDFDFVFNLIDGPDPISDELVGAQTHLNVPVEDGLFHVELDFGGGIFNGTVYWLEVEVRSAGVGGTTSLVPLQRISRTPYAIDADTLDGVDSGGFISTESDPTVPPNVKDGIDWSELSNIPAGFADDEDNGSDVPIGTVVLYAGTAAPSGWVICDGSQLSRTTFPQLFSAIGTAYGAGDGVLTFNVPDLQGRVAVGAGQGTGLTNRPLGEMAGEEVHVLTVNEMPSHNHEIIVGRTSASGSSGGTLAQRGNGADRHIEVNEGFAGGDQAHNIMQPYTAVNFIIRAF